MALLLLMATLAGADVEQCVVYSDKRSAVSGVLELAPPASGPRRRTRTYDGYSLAAVFADDRARTCKVRGMVELLDSVISAYRVKLDAAGGECLLMLELSAKRVVLRDRSGSCAQALCGGQLELDGVKLVRERGTRPCAQRPTEQPDSP